MRLWNRMVDMRIISQNGMIDVPYEQISIEIKENEIWCGYYATLEQHCIAKKFARYSTEAKAKKAMEMLRTAYAGKFVTNADISEDFNERLKELMKGGFGTVVVKETNDCRVARY